MGFGSFINDAKKATVSTVNKAQGKDKIESLEAQLRDQQHANQQLTNQLNAERGDHTTTKTELALMQVQLEETTDAAEGEKGELEATREELAAALNALEKANLDCSRLRSALQDAEDTHSAFVEEQDAEASAAAAAAAKAEFEALEADESIKAAAKEASVAAFEAMDKFSTDVTGLLKALAPLDTETLQVVKATYFAEYGHDLTKRVKKKTSGLTRQFILGLLRTRVSYFGEIINSAVSGITTDDDAVAEIVSQLSKDEITELLQNFPEMLGNLQSALSGNTKKFVLTLLQNQRPDSGVEDVAADAEALYKAGQGKMVGTNPEVFKEILAGRSAEHLKALNTEYKSTNKKEKTLEEAVKSLYGGSQKIAYLTSLRFQMDSATNAAVQLESAMKGLGCDEAKVIQILTLWRHDFPNLEAAYNARHGQGTPLLERLKDELSGILFTGTLVKGICFSLGLEEF